jgi:mRNA-degrading endonuclease toxin of MazEF toxin-antitoxin module
MGHELEGGHWWVVLSPTALNAQIQLFTAVPLTSVNSKKTGKPKDDGDFRLFRIRVLATEKTKDPGRVDSVFEGESIALTEQTRSFSSLRIKDEQRAGTVTAKALGAIEAGLQFIIGTGIIRRHHDVPAAVRAGPGNMPKEPPKPLPGQPFHTHHK